MMKRLRGGSLQLVRRSRTQKRREAKSGEVADLIRLARSPAVETLPVPELRPNPNNARLHSDRQIAQIAASIIRFGFLIPILIDEDNTVLAGNGRLMAAKSQGLSVVPVIRVVHLTAAEKRAYALADNRLSELSAWDFTVLKTELEALATPKLEFDYEVTGFDTADIDRLVRTTSEDTDRVDPADELPLIVPDAPSVSRIGDTWRLGDHRLVCGDAQDGDTYRKLLGSGKASMVFTDPPYNVPIDGNVARAGRHRDFIMASGELSPHEFTTFLEQSFCLAREHSADGAIHFICMDWRHLQEILAAAAPVYGAPKQLCVWVKDNAGMGTFYRSRHELVFVFKAGTAPHINNFGLGEGGRHRTNVWQYPRFIALGRGCEMEPANHPTVKPVALVADAIRDCSKRAGIILDPFGGSGTTLIAAERTGRAARIAELDPAYVDLIVKRWQAFTGDQAVHDATGRTFDELVADITEGGVDEL